MQQIADWLKTLGMSEYAQRFAENDIDFTVLPHLTDQHLREARCLARASPEMLRAIADLKDFKSANLKSPCGRDTRRAAGRRTPPSAAKSR